MRRMPSRPLSKLPLLTVLPVAAFAAVAALAGCATGQGSPAPAAPSNGTSGGFPGAGAATALPAPTSGAFESLEGPLWVAAQNALLFSDVVEKNGPAAHIYRFDPAARSYAVVPTPETSPTSTNGLAVDPQGRLIATERYNGRLVRIEADGKLTVLASRWPAADGPALNAPNDVVVRADGNIYFTDSDWGVRTDVAHAPMAVYRVSPAGDLSRVLELQKPNGIALSPDGTTLYVGSDTQGKVWRLPLDGSGAAGQPTLLIDGASVPDGFKVPDGICVDDAGNLYVTNNDDAVKAIVVFDPAGHLLGRIAIPFRPSNCTFGGADRRTMYVTTLHAVFELRVPTPGLP